MCLTILVSDAISANDMDNTRGVSQNYEAPFLL